MDKQFISVGIETIMKTTGNIDIILMEIGKVDGILFK